MSKARSIVFISALMSLLMASSCGKKSTAETPFSSDERAQIEQQLEGCSSVDTLLAMLSDYEHEHNVLGQIVAQRYIGRLCRDQSHFDWAISHHQQGLQLAREAGDTLEQAQALNNLGTNYRRMGALSEGMDYHLEALRLSLKQDTTGQQQVLKNRIVALNGIGNIYLTMGNLTMADSMFTQSLAGEVALGSLLGQAINLANLGSIREQQGDLAAAWALYRQSMELNEQIHSQLGISLCHSNYGRLHERSGRYEEALSSYERAYAIMTNSPDHWHRLEAALNMARVLLKMGRYDRAASLLERIDQTAHRIESLEHQAQVHQLWYELYTKLNDPRRALENYVEADRLRDSLIDMSKVLQIQTAQLEVERERKQEALRQAEQDLTQMRHSKRVTSYLAGLLLLLALGGMGVLWYILRARTAHQRMLRQLSRTREQFFTNVTHEFRTPLTVILGLGHLLEDQDVEDMGQVRSAAKMIVRQGNSLLSLINQLLDISKVRSAVGEAKWRHGNIVPFVGMIVENFQPYAASKRIELSFSHSVNDISTDFVPDYMVRIVSNLLGNAMKWTPTYGKVNLTLESSGGNRLKLQVFDTGRGIAPEALPHLFEAFYQGPSAEGQDMGTGIGLSLVKLMTEAMNGTVNVDSVQGQGSTFTVVIPIVQGSKTALLSEADNPLNSTALQPQMQATDEPEVATATKARSTDQPPTTILIVEDNQDIAYYVGMHLPGHRLLYARNGAEALEKAKETMPDLVITDLMMPGPIDGLELCRRMRSSQLLNHVPIIIITAKTTEDDRVRGLQAGADAYLVKPFNSEELLVRVEKLLERQQLLRQKFMLADAQPATELSAEDRQFMNKLIDQIYLLMSQGHVDVESLAACMALSRSQLNRRVLAITGQNTSAYVMNLRLARSKRLLMANVQVPVGDVALKCGFDDVAYFSRIFRQTFGMTPSQYRKQS